MNAFKKHKIKLLLLGILAVFVYFGFVSEYNFFRLYRLHQKRTEMVEKIEQSEAERLQLYSEINRLRDDSTYIEKIAREEFNMGRPGEKIFLLEPKDSQ